MRAVAWDTSGYDQFIESALREQGIDAEHLFLIEDIGDLIPYIGKFVLISTRSGRSQGIRWTGFSWVKLYGIVPEAEAITFGLPDTIGAIRVPHYLPQETTVKKGARIILNPEAIYVENLAQIQGLRGKSFLHRCDLYKKGTVVHLNSIASGDDMPKPIADAVRNPSSYEDTQFLCVVRDAPETPKGRSIISKGDVIEML